MDFTKKSRTMGLYLLLITFCFVLLGCPEFKSIEQPSSVAPSEIFTVFIEAITGSNEDEFPVAPYFGICLPQDWTIPGDSITCTGAYNGIITYDPNLALEQESLSPSPEGYYWWVGDGNAAYVEGFVYSEIQIQTGTQLGSYYLDYMLGNSVDGLNQQDRSNNHLICIVYDYTPRGLQTAFQGDSVFISWAAPYISEGLTGYNVYRDGQLISTIPDENNEYTDEQLPDGVFNYSVSAVYEGNQEYITPYEVKGLVFSEGTGEPNDPYQIAYAEQLVSIADFPALTEESFVLIDNIDLDPNLMGEYAFEQSVIPRFSGTFDGNDFVISNLTLTGFGNLGLIGTIENCGVVQNLGVVDANITGNWNDIGIIAGYNYGTLSNSYSTGSVTGEFCIGGLVGRNSGQITSCYSDGSVTGDFNIGGLVGYNYGSIKSCFSTDSVTGDSYDVGGLVGCNYGSIMSCYSTGAVTGITSVGGLVGYNYDSITTCYSIGLVTGDDNVGGLVGYSDGSVIMSFWDRETSGHLFGDWGWSMTTAEMMTESTYIGWNNGLWVIDEGRDYPHLLWEETAGEIIDYEYTRVYPGNGQDQPFELDSPDDMLCMSLRPDDWDKNFILTGNIDMLSVFCYRPPMPFSGSFDGQNHVLKNLTIDANGICQRYYLGVFGKIEENGIVANLGVENVNIFGGSQCRYVGGLCGENDGGLISCCFTTGSVSGDVDSDFIGGLCGNNKQGTIIQSYSSATVSAGEGSYDLGGLVGYNNGTITSSYSNNWETGETITGDENVGGLVGYNDNGDINDCYRMGIGIIGNDNLGGLVGYNNGTITSSYCWADVTGDEGVGGLVGYNDNGDINDCYCIGFGIIGNDDIGGLVGYNNGTITSSYSDNWGTVNGDEDVGGLVGYNSHLSIITDCYSTKLVIGNDNVGGLVGYNYGSITASSNTCTVSGVWYVGGLVGQNRGSGNITSNYSSGIVSGVWYVGGLVGNNYGDNITMSYSTGAVNGYEYVGGLVGYNRSGGISASYSNSMVNGGNIVGGLVGRTRDCSITNCYSNSSVNGNSTVGGLVGYNYNSRIEYCYSNGSVTGNTNIGGLVGYDDSGTVTFSFWDIDTSGLLTSVGGTGLNTAEMQTQSTFTNAEWDFINETENGSEDIWWIDEGNDYPRLWWEIIAEN